MVSFFKKIFLFLAMFLLPLISILTSSVSINNSNRKVNNNINFQNTGPELLNTGTPLLNIHTDAVDWSAFNQVDQGFPNWDATISQDPGYTTNNFAMYVSLYDATSPIYPNPNWGVFDWNKLYAVANVLLDFENSSSLSVDNNTPWVVTNPIDYNNPNLEVRIVYFAVLLNSGLNTISPIYEANPHMPFLNLTMEPGVMDTKKLGAVPGEMANSNVVLNGNNDFDVSVDVTYNDGPAHTKILANGVEIYNNNILADTNVNFQYSPPLEYTDYTFEFYINDVLEPTLTKTVKSGFNEATIANSFGYEAKPNYQPSIGSIPVNGEAGAGVTLDNPSNITVDNVKFVLKDNLGGELATKLGSVAPGNLNTYEAVFNNGVALAPGNYTIDYTVNFNSDPLAGPTQSPLTGSVTSTITTVTIPAPEISFDEIVVSNHPSYIEGVSNWDNGTATVNYVIDQMSPENIILTIEYTLHETTNGIITTGTINPANSNGNITFNNLEAGNYYITWNMTWALNSEAGTTSHSGQTLAVDLVEVERETPIILATDLTATDWYNPTVLGIGSGTITLHDFADIIGKTITITPTIGGIDEPSQNFVVPSNGIIDIGNWELAGVGDYTFTLKVLDYKITSDQVDPDYIIGTTPIVTVVVHQFEAPNIGTTATRFIETNTLSITFESLDGPVEDPWIDIDGFNAVLEVRYADGTIQQIPFTEQWPGWDINAQVVTFDFNLDNTADIDVIFVTGQFKSNLLAGTRSINIVSPFLTTVNPEVNAGWGPGIIFAIIAGSFGLADLLLFWPILFSVRKYKRKDK